MNLLDRIIEILISWSCDSIDEHVDSLEISEEELTKQALEKGEDNAL